MNNKEKFFQKDLKKWFLDIESKIMLPVYANTNIFASDVMIRSCLIPKELIDIELSDYQNFKHDALIPGFIKYGDGEISYLRFGNSDGIEPLITEFNYEGLCDDHIELTEEFRQLFSLYYNNEKQEYICPNDNDLPVCKIDSSCVTINKKYLKSFLTSKEKVLLIYINSQIQEGIEKEKYDDYDVPFEADEAENTCGSVVIGSADGKNYSLLRAKKVIFGCPLKQCNLWPFNYNKEHKYMNFIIGIDKDGNEIEHSCDPSDLSNYFYANPNKPHYLTPIFFDRAVLEKYISQPDRYIIEPGILRCGSLWSIDIDNEHPDYISAYLGDLGRYLPTFEEQCYWRGYNRVIDGYLSKAKIERDFNANFSNTEAVDSIFKNKFQKINEASKKSLNWPLFLELSKEDIYNFTTLRIPLRETQEEFDSLILHLVKPLIDSLNEDKINEQLSNKEIHGGISKLEKWFEEKNLKKYEEHINFLRDLQKLRSTGTCHRKGDKYKQIKRKFSLTKNNFKLVFTDILERAIAFLQYFSDNLPTLSQ